VDSRRLESFSDGVFAVAITVLVFNLLTIGEKNLSYGTLVSAATLSQYFAYVVGFLTIGIMWLNHHTMVMHVSRVDRVTLVLNIFLLMTVVAVPFPTALVADHLRKPGAAAAVVSYGVLNILLSIAFASMWSYLSTHQEALGAASLVSLSRAERFGSVVRFGGGLIAYIAGTLVAALWSPIAGLVIFGLTGVYYLFEHLPSPAAGGPEADAGADRAVTG
jgi:TMEM175 potassium channel family protein